MVQEAFEELLDKQNILRSELTIKDSHIEELRKENEVNVQYVSSCVATHICSYSFAYTHFHAYKHTYLNYKLYECLTQTIFRICIY